MRKEMIERARQHGPEVKRGKSAEEPADEQTKKKARPVRTFLLRFPLLSGLLIGGVLGSLTRFLLFKAFEFFQGV